MRVVVQLYARAARSASRSLDRRKVLDRPGWPHVPVSCDCGHCRHCQLSFWRLGSEALSTGPFPPPVLPLRSGLPLSCALLEAEPPPILDRVPPAKAPSLSGTLSQAQPGKSPTLLRLFPPQRCPCHRCRLHDYAPRSLSALPLHCFYVTLVMLCSCHRQPARWRPAASQPRLRRAQDHPRRRGSTTAKAH